MTFQGWPDVRNFEDWKNHFYREVASKSSEPKAVLSWLFEIETAPDCASLYSPVSKDGRNFESLDFKMSASLWKILKGDMLRKLTTEERTQTKENPVNVLSGRQIAYHIFEHFSLPAASKEQLDVNHLYTLELKNDNLKQFSSKWDEIIIQLPVPPADVWVEPMYRKQLEKSVQFAPYMALYKHRIALQEWKPSYQKLKELLSFFLADLQNQSHIRSLTLPQAAMPAVKPDAPKPKVPDCLNWMKKGKCAKKDSSCAFAHDPAKSGIQKKKTERGRSPTPSPGKGRGGKGKNRKGSQSPKSDASPSKKSSRGASPSNKSKQASCKDWKVSGTCKWGEKCKYWHPPPCKFFAKGSCKAGSSCPYPHRNGTATPNNADKPSAGLALGLPVLNLPRDVSLAGATLAF